VLFRLKKEQRGATVRETTANSRHRQTQERDRGKDRLASSVSPKTNKVNFLFFQSSPSIFFFFLLLENLIREIKTPLLFITKCLFLSSLNKFSGLLMYGDLQSLCPLSYQSAILYINIFLRKLEGEK